MRIQGVYNTDHMMVEQGRNSPEAEVFSFFPSMTFEQTEMLQNAGRQILLLQQQQARVLSEDERNVVFDQREIPLEHRRLGPGARIQFTVDGQVVSGVISGSMMWLEHQMYHIPDDAEDRAAYEQAVQDVANHTFHLHLLVEAATDEPLEERTYDVRELGLLSEVLGVSQVQVR